MIRIPIPIFKNNVVYTDVDFKKPTSGVLADTQKAAQNRGDYYSAITKFLSGCLISIYSEGGEQKVEDKVSLKSIVPHLPFRSAEYLAIQIMLLYHEEDGVEGVYYCPRCGHKIICELVKDTSDDVSVDTRDFIKDLHVEYMEICEPTIHIDLRTSVKIKSQGDTIEEITDFEMEHPTLNHCMKSFVKYGDNDRIRTQFGIYAEALTKVNGELIDSRWKNAFGMALLSSIEEKKDLIDISNAVRKYGYSPYVKKECPSCEKQWDALLPTENFFVYALQQEF